MGLDITYYSKLTEAKDNEAFDATGELKDDEWIQIYVNDDFPGRADRLKHKHAYKFESSDGFVAGSYSGYNSWREELAKLIGYTPVAIDRFGTGKIQIRYDAGAAAVESGPFWELINFSDCEGVIGPATSAKLAKDFMAYQEKADQHEDEWFRFQYAKWRKAFEVAADNGAVEFH